MHNNIQIKLVSYNLIKLLYNDKINLNNCQRVHYFARNNKLLIEYSEKAENDSILIINPLEDKYNHKIFIFKIQNLNLDKMDFYKELLSKDKINLKYFKENKNIKFNNVYTYNNNDTTLSKQNNNK